MTKWRETVDITNVRDCRNFGEGCYEAADICHTLVTQRPSIKNSDYNGFWEHEPFFVGTAFLKEIKKLCKH